MKPMRARRPEGFTLIELMVTIAIAAILLVVAAPSFVTFQRNSQLTSAANSLVAAIAAARAEAMKRQLNTFVLPKTGGWGQGWTVFVDTNWSGAYETTDGLPLIEQPALATSINTITDGTPGYIMFNGAGFPQLISSSPPASTLNVQLGNGSETRFVLVTVTGRIRACKPDPVTCTTSDTF